MSSKRTLKQILDSEYVEDSDDDAEVASATESTADVEEDEEEIDRSFCIECKDMKTEILCKDCEENFCVVCFEMIHRSGRRKKHEYVKISLEPESLPSGEGEQQELQDSKNGANSIQASAVEDDNNKLSNNVNSLDQKMLSMLAKHAKFIPMRLTPEERHLLRLLEAALHVSEYTDRVDIISYKSKAKRIVEQLKEMCSVLCGLVIASNLKIGQKLASRNEEFQRQRNLVSRCL